MPPTTDLSSEAQICVILEQNIKPLSHNGFVYALATAKLSTQDDRQFLISGAGLSLSIVEYSCATLFLKVMEQSK